MNTFLLGPEKPKEDAGRKEWELWGRLRWFQADKVARGFLEKMIRKEGHWERYTVEDIDEIWFDFGGMVSTKENKVSFIVNDTNFCCYARHLPILMECLSSLKADHKEAPGCVLFRGFRHLYSFSKETCDAMILETKELEKKHADDIIEDVDRIRDVFKKHGDKVHQKGRIV